MRSVRRFAWCVGALISIGASSARAQEVIDTSQATAPPPPGVSASLDSARAVAGAPLVVSLYTYGPSDFFAERFGHIALGIRNTATGQDIAFNWGIFDFDQPNFLGRFLTGDTKYWMAGYSTRQFNELYQSNNRTIRRQVLALTPVERAALLEYVQWNSRDEHKYYRYDYYRDNCSTRVRDIIDRTLGGRLKASYDTTPGVRTWRGETQRILEYSLPLYAGIMVALGRHADEPLSPWNEEFLPEHMATHLASAVLTGADGQRYRLIESDSVLFSSTRAPLPSEPPAWLAMTVLLGITIAGIIAGLADAKSRGAHVILSIVVALWYFVGGLLGTALLLAATVTKHVPYMGANTTLFVLQPLMLLAAVVVPRAFWRQERTRTALGVTAVIAALSVIGVFLQLVPSLRQHSGQVFAMVVPTNIALAVAMRRLGQRTNSRRASARG